MKKRTKGAACIRWIEAHCVHPSGPLIGQPISLLPWQKRMILDLFEVESDGRRRYRWAFISVPKKQGKTSLIAMIGLYLLIGDDVEPAPVIVCAAASDDQADLIFQAAATICRMSPSLRQVAEVFEREIVVPSKPGAKLRRVAAASGTNDGQNLSAVLIDELHEWTAPKSEQVWNVLTNATGARPEPLIVQITTAGYNPSTIWGRQYDLARKIANGEVNDRAFFSYIVEAPEGADHTDPKVWEAANPSYGVTVQPAFYADQLTKKPEAVFRRYFLNQPTQSEESWLPSGAWDACLSDLQLDPALPTHVGVDVARTHDASAVVLAQLQGPRIVLRAKTWTNPYPPSDPRHADWTMELATIENYLRDVREQFPVATRPAKPGEKAAPGPAIYFDPWRFDRSAELLRGDGLNCIDLPQQNSRMAPISMNFYEQIAGGKIAHDGDPVLARHIAAAIRKDVSDRAWRLTKPVGSPRHIDACIAGAIAAYFATDATAPTRRPSRYNCAANRLVIV